MLSYASVGNRHVVCIKKALKYSKLEKPNLCFSICRKNRFKIFDQNFSSKGIQMNKIVIASAIAAIALAACGKEEVKAPVVPAVPKIEVPAAVAGAVDATKAAAAAGVDATKDAAGKMVEAGKDAAGAAVGAAVTAGKDAVAAGKDAGAVAKDAAGAAVGAAVTAGKEAAGKAVEAAKK
jgi:hypothetical protein